MNADYMKVLGTRDARLKGLIAKEPAVVELKFDKTLS